MKCRYGLVTLGLLILSLGQGLPAHAGATGGPRQGSYNLDAGKTITWSIAFEANKSGIVAVTHSGDSSMNVGIYIDDPDTGATIAAACGMGSSTTVLWNPTVNRCFTVRVVNFDKEHATSFDLLIN